MKNVKSKSNSTRNITGYGSKAHTCDYDWIYEIVKNTEKLVETLNKQIPKKVKCRRILYNFNDKPFAIQGDCPCCCNEELSSNFEHYCPRCGQKLDWSEDENE